jgi:hypothetical protein
VSNRTTDLVARIREHEGAYLFPKTADALLKEAADEIERLNEQLMKAFGVWPERCNKTALKEAPMKPASCIHRAGCPKPDVCGEVGHCTSQTREGLETEKALTSNLQRVLDAADSLIADQLRREPDVNWWTAPYRRLWRAVNEAKSGAVETGCYPEYTNAIGDAGSQYMQRIGGRTSSGLFYWHELWDALNAAAYSLEHVRQSPQGSVPAIGAPTAPAAPGSGSETEGKSTRAWKCIGCGNVYAIEREMCPVCKRGSADGILIGAVKSTVPISASTDDGAPPSRNPSSSVECPKCRTQLAFEGDECGLCKEEA